MIRRNKKIDPEIVRRGHMGAFRPGHGARSGPAPLVKRKVGRVGTWAGVTKCVGPGEDPGCART